MPFAYADNASSMPLSASKSKLSKDQVLLIAQSAIKSHGFKPDDFHSPDVYIRVSGVENKRSWTVYFRHKARPINGDCIVEIDDDNGKYKLVAMH